MAQKSAKLRPLLAPWLRSLAEGSPQTARAYERAVTKFLDQTTDVTMESVAAYLGTLSELSPSSRAHYISAVRSFLKFADRAGVPVKGVPLELLKRPKVTFTSYDRYLTLPELRSLVEAAHELSRCHYAAIVGLAGLGLRVEEATRASWGDLFTDPAGRIGLRVLGKGGRQRVVKVRPDVMVALVATRREEESPADPLLVNKEGTRAATRTIRTYVYDARDKAGLTKPVSPHFLRHTHATLAAYGGADIFTIQESMGHAKMDTSAIYLHIARGLEQTTVDFLPEFTVAST